MSKPMRLDEFTRLPARARATTVEGLSSAVDLVADRLAGASLLWRYQWYAADLAINGGAARTIIVEQDGDPVIALPLTGGGRRTARLLGAAWPARGFPTRLEAGEAAFDALLDELGRQVAALAIGPSDPSDRAIAGLLAAARRRQWRVRGRPAVVAAPIDGALRTAADSDPLVAEALCRTATPPALSDWLIVRPGLVGWLARFARAQRTTSRV